MGCWQSRLRRLGMASSAGIGGQFLNGWLQLVWSWIPIDASISYGGREASLEAKAKKEANQIAQDGKSIAGDAKAGAEGIIGDVKQKAGELKQKVVK